MKQSFYPICWIKYTHRFFESQYSIWLLIKQFTVHLMPKWVKKKKKKIEKRVFSAVSDKLTGFSVNREEGKFPVMLKKQFIKLK